MTATNNIRTRNRTRWRARGRGEGQWTPQYLGLLSLYDGHVSGSAAAVSDSSGNSQTAVAFAAAGASPLWLPWEAPRVWQSGTTDKFVSSTSTAGPTTALDARVAVALDDWTPAGIQVVASHGSAPAPGATFRWYVTAGGAVTLGCSNGTAFTSVVTSSTTGFADGTIGAIRVTWRSSDGRVQVSKKTTTVATAKADVQANTGWTQIDGDLTGLASAMTGTFAWGFGGYAAASTGPMAGSFYYGQVSTTVDAAPVVALDPSYYSHTSGLDTVGSLGLTFTASRATSGRKLAVQSIANGQTGSVIAGTDDYATGPVGAIPPATAGAACALFCVCRPFATMATNMTFFSTRSGAGAGVTLRMASATTVVADVSDGSTTVTTPAVTITPGLRYVLGVNLAGGAPGTAWVFANSTEGGAVARNGTTETGGAVTIFASSTPANFADVQSRVLYGSRSSVLSAVDLVQMTAYYGGGL